MATPSISEYRRKRDFRRSPEPAIAPPGAAPALQPGHLYVMHKHAARRLYFDLRIEQDGVLFKERLQGQQPHAASRHGAKLERSMKRDKPTTTAPHHT
ncbi:hypothetical protein [Candidatus Ferrigenium straubiae]|jgi:hypothetical protein|uniref:hypothetical protein n=1 Tax=Candidatus Ferrigenium straubiae TaxID=2919506 RepID=UPI003F4A8E0F